MGMALGSAHPFLGMLESCVAPILILIISMFYTKNEQVCAVNKGLRQESSSVQGRRISWFYLMVRAPFFPPIAFE